MNDVRTIKDDGKFQWTMHSKFKLLQYALSPSLVKRVIRFPERTEEGIAPNTVAVMRRKDSKSKKQELWVMYQRKSKVHPVKSPQGGVSGIARQFDRVKISGERVVIISAWIYPGTSPKGKEIFIPDEVLMELEKLDVE